MTDKLFTPVTLGDVELKNRVVMAPLTRNRAKPEDDTPYAIHAEYYAQRAGAGLIISEGSQISPEGKGYAWTPGIHSEAQVAGWKAVTDAVHAKGGKIAIQLWHVGRISHVSLLEGNAPVAPSAIGAASKTFDGTQFVETSVPRALEEAEIARVVDDYRKAAENAQAAGFDGVEIHAANGYLIDQFLRDTSNTRTDGYGGSQENRVRFLDEVVGAVVGVLGAGRVGIRFSPFSNANNVGIDSDTVGLFSKAIDVINKHGLAFLHMVEGQTGGPREWPEGALETLRSRFNGVYIANNAYDRAMAVEAVASGKADAVAFGKLYISNPDLAERLAADAPLNPLPTEGLYGGGAEGYTDYPTLEAAAA
ncbi:alkene reductase [Cereibacter changlensis]|uniref:Alkene reductase n=2 Tax=Cereibacter changlensis TaxID=402884 RepID=A0A2T4JQ08_9RHOB|nr:alkene reductase [Cereibacter changlensis]PTE20020.1 alkene reductase [Cereibacter changlensis JA139]PZX54232.1 N-ethylmaleimide reductase [Cereibacter changlensis]